MSSPPGPRDDWSQWNPPRRAPHAADRSLGSQPGSASPADEPAGEEERQGPLAVYGPGVAWTTPQRGASAPPLPDVPPPLRAPRITSRRPRRRRLLLPLIAAALVITLCATLGSLTSRLMAFGAAISPHQPLSTQTGYMNGVGRVNLVVLGYGGAGHDGAYLTDTIMVISLSPGDRATTLISVPRDLWVQIPPSSGQRAKLNTAYQNGYYNGFDAGYGKMTPGRMAGGLEAASKVSEITGLNVSYFMTIDFQGFRDLVDAMGGVDINVPTAFTARYPIENDPTKSGWKTIHFSTGMQHMNGERAIEYARARYVLEPASEGTDFARALRQQLLMRAIVSRMHSPSAWPGLSSAMTALEKTVYTNLSLADLSALVLKMDLSNAAHVGLSNQNVLVDAQSADGQAILLPHNGDWNAVSAYVSDHLKQ